MSDLSALLINAQRQAVDYFLKPEWPNEDDFKKNINIVLRGDGIYEVRKTPFSTFCTHKKEVDLPGFPKEDNNEWFLLNLPTIPKETLEEIIAFFQYFCRKSKKNDEAYIQIFWDQKKKKYFTFCPKQTVGSASVRYERDQELEKKNWLVCEIHSHNSMEAFFSTIDDQDEQNDRFYCVLGNLDKAVPALKSSFVSGGKRVIIENEDLWSIKTATFPEEWKSKVEKMSPQIKITAKGKNNSTSIQTTQEKGEYGETYQDQDFPYFSEVYEEDYFLGDDKKVKLDLAETGNLLINAIRNPDIELQELEQFYLEFLMAMSQEDFKLFIDTIKNMDRADEVMQAIGFSGASLNGEENE